MPSLNLSGKPDAGNPPVRFDEGRGDGLCRPSPTLLSFVDRRAGGRASLVPRPRKLFHHAECDDYGHGTPMSASSGIA
jgi:hypothetical protein